MSISNLPEIHTSKGENIWTFHKTKKHKTVYYTTICEEMEITREEKPVYVYKAKTFPYHGLHKSFLTIQTPKIQVKEKYLNRYTIRFCPDLFINMIKKFKLIYNNVELQSGNFISLFIYKNKQMKDIQIEHLGNDLSKPCSVLNPTDISLYLPWSYNLDKSDFFPLIYCGEKDSLEHKIDFSFDLAKLLIIEENDQMVPFDPDIIEIKTEFSVPKMLGVYTELEKDQYEDPEFITLGPIDYYVRNIVYQEGDKNIKFDCKSPVFRLDWGCKDQNQEIISTSLSSKSGFIFKDLPSYLSRVAIGLGKNIKPIKGIASWENNILESSDTRKFPPCFKLDGGKISHQASQGTDQFFCILNTIDKFRFISYPRNNNERKTKKTIIKKIDH